MTKDVEMAEAATFASAFIDKVCFQAPQIPMPSGRTWESDCGRRSPSYANMGIHMSRALDRMCQVA